MNKKIFLILVAAGLFVYLGMRVYHGMKQPHAPASARTAPVAKHKAVAEDKTKPATTQDKEATAMNKAIATAAPVAPSASDQDLIKQYTAQIDAKKDDDGNALYQRGLLYQKLQRCKSAIEDFTMALNIKSGAAPALYARGVCYQQENMSDNAIKDFSQAIKAKPDYAQAYNARGLAFVDTGDIKSALADYNTAIKTNPQYVEAYFNLGTLYERQKQYPEAIKAYTDAITNNVPPKDATPEMIADAKVKLMQSTLRRAIVEMLSNNFKAALQDATYVITYDPKNIDAYKLRAQIYQKFGNNGAALNDTATADALGIQNLANQKAPPAATAPATTGAAPATQPAADTPTK